MPYFIRSKMMLDHLDSANDNMEGGFKTFPPFQGLFSQQVLDTEFKSILKPPDRDKLREY